MDIHKAFKVGAKKLAQGNRQYSELHKAHGIEQAEWDLLTQEEYWTPDESRAIRSILANAIEVSMTIAGMPAVPLPGQYTAAFIAEVVSPCNIMLDCIRSPDTFDAFDASGIMSTFEVKDMPKEQLMSLVLAYSGGYPEEPVRHKLPRQISEEVRKTNQKTKSQAGVN